MKHGKKRAAAAAIAIVAAATLTGCAANSTYENEEQETEITEQTNEEEQLSEIQTPEEEIREETPEPIVPEPPTVRKAVYLRVTGDGVALRTGAGTGYTKLGTAEKDTLYAYLGEQNGWYKTGYKNKTAFVSAKYCVLVDMEASRDEEVEAVIGEGAKLLGTKYVYGATRLHDGEGNLLRGFKVSEFDCSSLMQYMFYRGADRLLNVNTRTQIYQGKTVKKADIQRGDLMFFTNASRKNNVGIERVGHVAIYLGDNYILHTASDYAKIERISELRWSYYIQSQRIIA